MENTINKIINKIKNFRQPTYICLLYFFVPIVLCVMMRMSKESDIWFLLNHGKYVLENGFPTIEPFSIHSDFSFTMQQWLSSVIFYLSYRILKQYGLLIVVQIINCFFLYFIYKLCMLLTDNRFRLSIITACITDIIICIFMIPRPWIFTFLNLVIVLYIMERFYKNRNDKVIYFLPIISLLQINLQSSMWFMLFLFVLPYLVNLFIDKIKNKSSKGLLKIFLILLLMFIVGFFNPYGLDNILYVFNSYGNYYINEVVLEMQPLTFKYDIIIVFSVMAYLIIFIEITIYIYHKKGKLQLRHMLLLLGVIFLALQNIRNIPLLVIGSIPFVACYIKNLFKKENRIKIIVPKEVRLQYFVIIIFLFFIVVMVAVSRNNVFTTDYEKGIDYILKTNNKDDIIMYNNYGNGSYIEYRGIKSYIDTRAEVFTKKINKKEDIMKEYYLLSHGYLEYNEFINKYKFTHLLVDTSSNSDDWFIYKNVLQDENYKVVYEDKVNKYKIFERK